MSLAARLAKLEGKHRQVLRCAWCRYALSSAPDQVQKRYKAAPESVLQAKCWYCGTKYGVPLDGLNDHQREATALSHNSHPSKRFTDERIHAAFIWLSLYRSEVEEYQLKQTKAQHKSGHQTRYIPSYSDPRGSLALAQEKAKREREELKQRAIEFTRAQTERFKTLVGGPQFFPLDQTLEQIEIEYSTSAHDNEIGELILSLDFDKYHQQASRLRSSLALCNSHLKTLKKREACEVVIWSAALPETREELEFFDREKQRQIEEAIEAMRREEEKNRAEAERLEAQERERIWMNEERQAEAKRQLREAEEQKALIAELLKQYGL